MNHEILDVDQLQHELATHSDVLLVDLLPAEVYERQHLPGAENACVFEVNFLDQMRDLTDDPAADIIVYGASANSCDAHDAMLKLTRAGYTRVRALTGGRNAWQQAGLPLEGLQPRERITPRSDPRLPDGDFQLDTDASRIHWTGRNIGGRHQGTVRLSEGNLSIQGHRLQGGRFVIAMDSIEVAGLPEDLRQMLQHHLASEDFFDVERFPTARFIIGEAHPLAGEASGFPNVDILGPLDLRGHTREIRFRANLARHREGGLALQAHFDIDRTRWGVLYGSDRFYENLGMHLVDDIISLELQLRLLD